MSTTPRNDRRRKTSLLSKARWAGYAAAGAATALGTYEAAEADIHHFTIDETVENRKFGIDLPGGASEDLVMSHQVKKIFDSHSNFKSFQGFAYANYWNAGLMAKIRGFSMYSGALYVADNFAKLDDKLINAPSSRFFSFGTMAAGPDSLFRFGERGQGYIGFSFDAGMGTQYGWLQVMMNGNDNFNSYTVVDYAYADPNEEIYAGQTQAVPEPGSLGLLAVGGIGLLLWRRNRRPINANN